MEDILKPHTKKHNRRGYSLRKRRVIICDKFPSNSGFVSQKGMSLGMNYHDLNSSITYMLVKIFTEPNQKTYTWKAVS